MALWREEVESALISLGGQGTLEEIYKQIRISAKRKLPATYQAIIRRELEYNSSDSESHQRRFDIFYSVKGIGSGVWGLRSAEILSPPAIDFDAPSDRIKTQIYRILRDTVLARRIKKLHRNECQICGSSISLRNGERYSEAHHIQPLGDPHNGPDIAENIIVLCPNHHAQMDYLGIEIEYEAIRQHPKHAIGQRFIEYHNRSALELAIAIER